MLKRFTRYVTQSVAGMIGISVYVLADTFFISVYSGADGLAVLNLILPVYGLIYAIGAMIGIGSATRYAISRAKGKNTEHYFVQSVTWSILAAVPFMLIGIFIPDKALALLGADAGLIGLGRNYVRIILIATPFFMSNYTFTAFARNDGAPSIAMIGSISGSIFNIIFDYIFMFPVGLGFSGAGLAKGIWPIRTKTANALGAGLATAICPIVTMSVCTIHYRSSRNHVGFHWKKPSFRHLISCCQLGVSAFVGELSSGVIAIVFNFLILGIAGNMGVAAYGVVANLSIVAFAIFNGLAQGAQPLISESYGKGQPTQVRKLLKWSLFVCLAVEALIQLIIWTSTDTLISIFNSENNVQLLNYAHTGLRLYFLGFIVAGINIVLVAYFSAVDEPKIAIVGSFLRGIVAIVICAVILAKLFGLNGIWISLLAAETVTFLTILFLAYKDRRKRIKPYCSLRSQ